MQKDFGFIFLILLSLVSGCKKDNNRIATPTYELDSVEAGYFDTLGNYIHLKTIVIEPNFILNQIPEGFMYDGSKGLTFEERNDSILYQQYLDYPYVYNQIFDYCYVVDGKFNSSYQKQLSSPYSDASCYISRQYINYNTNGNLASIINSQNNFFTKDTSIYSLQSRRTQELSFLYSGNNISSIQLNCILNNYSGGDTTTITYNTSGSSVSYSNHYQNQKTMIGFDVNDIIFSSLLDLNAISKIGYNRLGAGVISQIIFYYLYMPEALLFTKHTTFNTNCDNLIEHIHIDYPALPGYGYFSLPFNASPDINIAYDFDTSNSNRIKSMSIQPSSPNVVYYPNNNNLTSLRYTFYYKN